MCTISSIYCQEANVSQPHIISVTSPKTFRMDDTGLRQRRATAGLGGGLKGGERVQGDPSFGMDDARNANGDITLKSAYDAIHGLSESTLVRLSGGDLRCIVSFSRFFMSSSILTFAAVVAAAFEVELPTDLLGL